VSPVGFDERRTILKKLLAVILLGVVLFTLALGSQAIAAVECPPDLANFPKGDAAAGAQVFGGKCVACHRNGGNIVKRNKTLKPDALEKYNMYSAKAIITQVTCGKGVMPQFGKQFTEEQIANVAAYVLQQADKW